MRFNKTTHQKTLTRNLAGGEAFSESPKLEFASILLTSFVNDQFYREAKDSVERLRQLIDSIPDKLFPAKAAVYARTKYGMRSVSHVVAAEIVNRIKGEVWVKHFVNSVVVRPDDMTEILAYYMSVFGKPVPNALKKGLALAIGNFDEYQLSKYRGEGAGISLIDLVNIVHPVPVAKNKEALKKLMAGELRATDTWESKLTKAGQDAEDEDEKGELKSKAWSDLIKEHKIGYFALLRNLRNIIEQAPDVIPQAIDLLTDANLIHKSLVLPFRYSTALEEIQKLSGKDARSVVGAINVALDESVSNVPKLEGRTLVALDESGSMDGRPYDIGSLFAAVLVKSNDADFIAFSNHARYRTLNPQDSTGTLVQVIRSHRDSGGTNFHAFLQEANQPYDRIIVLSDMQGWVNGGQPSESLTDYRRRTGADPKVYSFDLAGHGTLQFPERNVFALAGFSEKVFEVLKLLDTDRNALISEIEKIEI